MRRLTFALAALFVLACLPKPAFAIPCSCDLCADFPRLVCSDQGQAKSCILYLVQSCSNATAVESSEAHDVWAAMTPAASNAEKPLLQLDCSGR
jgi:hypothetical protein